MRRTSCSAGDPSRARDDELPAAVEHREHGAIDAWLEPRERDAIAPRTRREHLVRVAIEVRTIARRAHDLDQALAQIPHEHPRIGVTPPDLIPPTDVC